MSSMSAFIALLVVMAVVFLALKLRALVHHGILGPVGIRLGHGHHVTDSSGFDDSSGPNSVCEVRTCFHDTHRQPLAHPAPESPRTISTLFALTCGPARQPRLSIGPRIAAHPGLPGMRDVIHHSPFSMWHGCSVARARRPSTKGESP